MTDLRAKLTAERTPASWRDLEASGQVAALVLVDPALDLIAAGVALAENDVASVKLWMGRGLLKNPGEGELSAWRAAPDTLFDMLIVQPFVLVQPQLTARA